MKKAIEEKIRIHTKKHNKMLIYGIKNKLIHQYPDALFDRLRPYHVGGFPASLILFIIEMCNGKCYDRSLLMQLAFNECEIIHADIETLRVTVGEEYAEHSFIVTKEFGGDKEWVVDTSMGLIYDKNYYYKFEKPKINKVITKEECMDFIGTKEIIAANFEADKYALPVYLPFIEECIKNSNWFGTIIYREKVLLELEKFKQTINYDALLKEVNEDIELMRIDSQKLDEKFGIVRDKYGREISRNGAANPYYISNEELEEKEIRYESIKNDKEKMKEFIEKTIIDSMLQLKLEEDKTSLIAKKRLGEIIKNPTANFYDKCAYVSQNIENKAQTIQLKTKR